MWQFQTITMPRDADESAPEVPIVCTVCETESRVPLSDVADVIEKHNEQIHDGEEAAEVDPALADHLADLVAEEMGLYDEPSEE
ncbi:hypothetical protein [Halostella sp. PRR32]|uniref:hypothetical protein n=1 Tax=Halostella sp. PRR32 TaxID=3098147 RepID=UPI002B1D0E8D|nr:hypothetical protein [Halostella sp. PRR32]